MILPALCHPRMVLCEIPQGHSSNLRDGAGQTEQAAAPHLSNEHYLTFIDAATEIQDVTICSPLLAIIEVWSL